MSRSLLRGLFLTASALTLTGRAGLAQCTAPDEIVIRAGGAEVRLTAGQAPRIPYGYQLVAFAKAPAGRDVRRATVEWSYDGHRDGPRSGTEEAVIGDAGCWSAVLPKLRINEQGRFEVQFLLEPVAKDELASPSRAVLLAFVEELRQAPAGLALAEHGPVAAGNAVERVFEEGTELVLTADGEETGESLVERLAGLATTDLRIFNAYPVVRSGAATLRALLDRAVGTQSDFLTAVQMTAFCRTAMRLDQLHELLGRVEAADDAALSSLFLDGTLPLEQCVVELLDTARARWPGGSGPNLAQLGQELITVRGVDQLLALRTRIMQLVSLTVQAKGLEVPFGAAILERYTQVDVVEAWIPAADMLQTFAAMTWYAWAVDEGSKAKVDPESFGDRLGFLFGYPVGDPLEGERSAFDPTFLIGVIGRPAPYISFSAGIVVGEVPVEPPMTPATTDTKARFFVSLNLDLTTFKPLEMLFARKDN